MKVAIIGYGYWGKILEKYLLDSNKFELVIIFSPSLRNEHIYTNDINKIINNNKIEAVFICSPVPTHFLYCKMLLQLGKHIFCEKPTTETLSEFDVLHDLAIKYDKVLFTDYIYTVSPSINKLKNLLPSIEPLSGISCKIYQNGRIYKNESVYTTIGVHMVSVIYYLLNQKPIDVLFSNISNEAYGFIQMTYPGNIKINIECNLLYPQKKRIILIYGRNGVLYFNMLEEKTIQIFQRTATELIPIEYHCFDEKNNLKLAIDSFRECINENDCRINIEISRNVLEIMNYQ